MANALYDLGREGFLDGSIDWDTDDIRAALVDTGAYTVDLANHKFLSSVASGARIATLGAGMSGKTVAAGVANASSITFSAVTGASIEAIVIYKHTGSDATARLIAYIDTATGLPLTPNGGDVTVQWDSGANKIFKL